MPEAFFLINGSDDLYLTQETSGMCSLSYRSGTVATHRQAIFLIALALKTIKLSKALQSTLALKD